MDRLGHIAVQEHLVGDPSVYKVTGNFQGSTPADVLRVRRGYNIQTKGGASLVHPSYTSTNNGNAAGVTPNHGCARIRIVECLRELSHVDHVDYSGLRKPCPLSFFFF